MAEQAIQEVLHGTQNNANRWDDTSNSRVTTLALTADKNVDFNLAHWNAFYAWLDIDAVTGTTPTLDVKFQTAPDKGGPWVDITSGAIAQKTDSDANTTAGLWVVKFANFGRAVLDVGGTSPSFTCALVISKRRYPV